MKTVLVILAAVSLVFGNFSIIVYRKTDNLKLKYAGLALLVFAWILLILRFL